MHTRRCCGGGSGTDGEMWDKFIRLAQRLLQELVDTCLSRWTRRPTSAATGAEGSRAWTLNWFWTWTDLLIPLRLHRTMLPWLSTLCVSGSRKKSPYRFGQELFRLLSFSLKQKLLFSEQILRAAIFLLQLKLWTNAWCLLSWI